MGKLLNFEYACIQGAFWMFYGVVGSFASVFLLARGYSNSEIGIVLAVGYDSRPLHHTAKESGVDSDLYSAVSMAYNIAAFAQFS